MVSKTIIAASLASAALATPVPASEPVTTFSMIAVHSGDVNVHLRPIVANGDNFWLGKNTTTFCPESIGTCSNYPGVKTVLTTPQNGLEYLAAATPGFQPVYVSPTGNLSFVQAHVDAVPEGGIAKPFTYTPGASANSAGSFTVPGDGIYACPAGEEGVYQIKSKISDALDFSDCTGIGIATFDTALDAFQYV